MKRAVVAWLVALALVFFVSDVLAQPGAAALEARLYAPCCYGGTLDAHESELARNLRAEIEGRLASGESSEAIQADFVARFGERVIAARSDKPIRAMGLSLLAVLVAAAIGLGFLLRRWTRRPTAGAPVSSTPQPFDDRIDAELAELD